MNLCSCGAMHIVWWVKGPDVVCCDRDLALTRTDQRRLPHGHSIVNWKLRYPIQIHDYKAGMKGKRR